MSQSEAPVEYEPGAYSARLFDRPTNHPCGLVFNGEKWFPFSTPDVAKQAWEQEGPSMEGYHDLPLSFYVNLERVNDQS